VNGNTHHHTGTSDITDPQHPFPVRESAAVQDYAVANLRRRPVVVEFGGLVAGFDPGTSSPSVNYATPLPGARPSARDVARLVGTFRERGLTPRLEFAPDAAPAVEPLLRAAGFATEAVHEYLVCTPATLTVPDGNRNLVETPATDEDYASLDAALREAYEGTYAPSPDGAARLRAAQERGGAVRFVRAPDGTAAGGACCSAPAVDTAELWGVATRPAFRNRGIAGAVTAALAEAVLARGTGSVWLEYESDHSRRIYERVGFRPHGTRLYLRLEA
jgi:ribosomal protein S18 acetylase RimI-like enzyme